MSPVTAKGIAAQARWNETADKFQHDVLWVLRTQGPTQPTLLHSYLRMVPGYEPSVVQEAMWRLLESELIHLKGTLDLEIGSAPE